MFYNGSENFQVGEFLQKFLQKYHVMAIKQHLGKMCYFYNIYVVPTGMEEAPKAALNIHCLQQGGGAALTRTINAIPPPRGDGGAKALTA